MANVKVSVIICNFNYGNFIGQAIESVLNQTFSDFQLIVVDDGSTDSSIEVIKSYDDKRITRIFQKNAGQASAFNAGLAASKGELVCFLDSDDWWQEDKLETILRWHELLNGDYSILQHGIDIWDEGKTSPYKSVLPSGDCFTEMCTTGNINFFVPTSGITLTKEVAEKVFPLPETLRISADAYLTRASLLFGNVYSIPQTLGYYRKHQNSVYKNKNFAVNKFLHEQLFPLLDQFYEKNNTNIHLFKERIQHYHRKNKYFFPYGIARKIRSIICQ